MQKYLTVDVGGTNIKYALMDHDAVILEKGEYPTPFEEKKKGFYESLKNVYDRYAGQVEALVMSAPGRIDSHRAYFYTSGALGYLDKTDFGSEIKKYIPVPVCVENDAKAAALAEIWKGSMKDIQNGIVMTLGTGIGGAVIIDGKLYRGSTYAAGEFSGIPTRLDHTTYDMKEMWAIGNGVGHMVRDYAERAGLSAERINGKVLFEAANNGDQNALDAIDQFCGTLASGIMSLQFVLDVQRVAVGGGISKQPLLMESLHKQIHRYYDKAAVTMPASIPEIVPCTFGNDANMIGALYHYLFEMK